VGFKLILLRSKSACWIAEIGMDDRSIAQRLSALDNGDDNSSVLETFHSLMSSLSRMELSSERLLDRLALQVRPLLGAQSVQVFSVQYHETDPQRMDFQLAAKCIGQTRREPSLARRYSFNNAVVSSKDLKSHLANRASLGLPSPSEHHTSETEATADSSGNGQLVSRDTTEHQCLQHVAITGECLSVSKGDEDSKQQSWLAAPIFDEQGKVVTAVVQAQGKVGSNHFDETDVGLLCCIGEAVGPCLSRARLYEEACQSRRRQEQLLEVIELAAAETDVMGVMKQIATASRDLLLASNASVYRYKEKNGSLVCKIDGTGGAVAQVGQVAQEGTWAGKHLYTAAKTQTTVNVTAEGQHLLVFPIFHEALMAVVLVQKSAEGRARFSSADQNLAMAIARVTGSLLKKAYLHERLEHAQMRSSALSRVLKAGAASASIGELINTVIEVAYEILNASRITLYFVDHLRSDLYCVVDSNGHVGRSVDMKETIAGYVARSGTGVNISDLPSDDGAAQRVKELPQQDANPGYHSLMAFPIKDAETNHAIAVLEAKDKQLGPSGTIGYFNDDDSAMLEAFCSGIAGTLRRHLTELRLKSNLSTSDQTVESLLAIYGYTKSNVSAGASSAPSQDRAAAACKMPPVSPTTHYKFTSTLPSKQAPRCKLTYQPELQKHATKQPELDKDAPHLSTAVADGVELLDGLAHTFAAKVVQAQAGGAGGENLGITLLEEEAQNPYSRLHLVGGVIVPALLLPPRTTTITLDELRCLSFNPFDYTTEELMVACCLMLRDVGCTEQNGIPDDLVGRFVQAVRSNYHDHAYHNWYHGVAVMHFSYLTLMSTKAGQFLNDLDLLALLVAALCHDLDHPGQGNAFQINARTELAVTHNDISVLENHHAVSTFQLLRKPAVNLFQPLSPKDFGYVRKVMIQAILATDMAHHYEICKKLDSQKNGVASLDSNNAEDRVFLCNLIVHASDLAGQVVPLKIAHIWQVLVASEFIKEESLSIEKGVPVAPFMQNLSDRETAYNNHINFIDLVMVPLWRGVINMFPELCACMENLKTNRAYFARRRAEEAARKARNTAASAPTTTGGNQPAIQVPEEEAKVLWAGIQDTGLNREVNMREGPGFHNTLSRAASQDKH